MNNLNNEVNKFNNLAHEWWELDGTFKTLHHLNPARLDFIKRYVQLEHTKIIDVGCGGGILSESLAANGANVTGIDLAPQSIEIAKLHLLESNLTVNYKCIDINEQAALEANQYDILTCMEMLEHVDNPQEIIDQCAKLLKPGGYAFFSTLNRNLKSYLFGIVAAEYLMNIVPRGTHSYQHFIKPAELNKMLKKSDLELCAISGVTYNPFTGKATLSTNTSINYLLAAKKC